MNPESTVVEDRPATDEEWDVAWAADSTATFFQSRSWAETWAEATGGRMRPAPLWFRLSDGSWGVLPITMDRRLKGAISVARLSPGSTWGGALVGAGGDDVRGLGASLLDRFASLELVASAFAPPLPDLMTGRGHTLAVSLDAPFEEVRSHWRSSHRRAVRKALAAPVQIDIARDHAAWQAYFATYQDSLRRWGDTASSRYPWALFAALAAREDPRVRLWIARADGQVIAGALCLDGQTVVSYWHGAALERALPLRPANLLLETAIWDTAQRGFAWFDLGPSGGHEGVERFKHGFAPRERPFAVLFRQPPIEKAARWAGRTWRGARP